MSRCRVRGSPSPRSKICASPAPSGSICYERRAVLTRLILVSVQLGDEGMRQYAPEIRASRAKGGQAGRGPRYTGGRAGLPRSRANYPRQIPFLKGSELLRACVLRTPLRALLYFWWSAWFILAYRWRPARHIPDQLDGSDTLEPSAHRARRSPSRGAGEHREPVG